jgi:2-C-methyl-D-erythritol 4-phosphate cytidylyltransferase
MVKNIVMILAGGKGNRFGLDIPKQFAKVGGKTIIEHTLDVFQKHPLIDEICVVSHKDWIWKIEEIIINNSLNKVKKIIEGGKERKDSSLSAIKAYENEKENINLIFHDAVRPFINDDIISECIERLKEFNAIDVAIPAVDTIIKVKNNFIEDISNREELMQGQTPQCFKLSLIKKAYEIAKKDPNFKVTDDCGVVKKYLPGEKIYVVKGDLSNIKLTHPQDIFIADKLFQLKRKKINLNENYKSLLKDKVLVIFGGHSGIGKSIGDLAEKYGAKVFRFSRSVNNIDISILENVKKALEEAYSQSNKIDYVVNTASILIKEPLYHMRNEDILKIININYIGAVNVAKESIKYLEETAGQLLNFTSSSYTKGRANYALYSSTKAAIVNLTQALAEELYSKKIRVNCINPERTLTSMRVKNFGKEDKNTLLTPEKVAVYSLNTLVSDMTGQIIDVKLQEIKEL